MNEFYVSQKKKEHPIRTSKKSKTKSITFLGLNIPLHKIANRLWKWTDFFSKDRKGTRTQDKRQMIVMVMVAMVMVGIVMDPNESTSK